jgi:hypothetical protein
MQGLRRRFRFRRFGAGVGDERDVEHAVAQVARGVVAHFPCSFLNPNTFW